MADATHAVSDAAPTQGWFHPIDSADAGEPDAKLAELRATCPVSRAEREGFPTVTVVTKYSDVTDTFRQYRVFGSIGSDPNPTTHDATPPDSRTIIALDPPIHTWARRVNNIAMAPGAVEAALPYVDRVARDLVDGFADRGEADLVAELAEPLPSRAIARVLGLPESDAAFVHDWVAAQSSEEAATASGQKYGSIPVLGGAFEQYLLEQLALRRGDDAPDDAITHMTRYRRDDGSHFSDRALSIHIRTLLNAGNETTTSLIANVLYRMALDPLLYERVVHERSLVAPAIEESLRLDAPLQVIIRRANTDATIGSASVDGGDVLAVSTLSANRDEAAWGPSAREFDVERFAGEAPAAHVGFGVGIHHCVGAYLARQTAIRGVNALDGPSAVDAYCRRLPLRERLPSRVPSPAPTPGAVHGLRRTLESRRDTSTGGVAW